MKYYLSGFIILIFALLMGCSSSSQMHLAPGDVLQEKEQIPIDSALTYGRLDNGLLYIIRVNKKPENRAELRLAVNAGSVLEDNDQKGLAHFVEHMAFNGTSHFKKQELVDYLESIGMKFGPEINAYTGFDETVYMLQVPTDSLEIMANAFQILEDWAHGISFEDEEIDKERGVITEEWRSGRGAEARMRDKQFPRLFQGSKYADRLPIGDIAVIDSFHYKSLTRFYHDWYRPDQMAVIAVGDFDKTWIEDQIVNHFTKLKNPLNTRKRDNFEVPDHDSVIVSIVTDPEAAYNTISLYFKQDLLSEQTVADYRRGLIENLYDTMLNQRLAERTREASPPYLMAYSGSGRLVRTKGVYMMTAIVQNMGIPTGLETLIHEARRVRMFGFTDTELERTKQEFMRGLESAFLEREKTESSRYASEYIRHFSSQEPIPGIEYEYMMFKQFLPQILIEEVNRLTDYLMSGGNLVILANGPEKGDLFMPDENDLLSVYQQAAGDSILPYQDNVSNEPLVSKMPASGRIIDEYPVDSLNVTTWILSNGIHVILKPTDFKNDEILFKAYSFGGSSLVPDSLYLSASSSDYIIQQSGVGAFDRTALEKKLAGKIVSVTPYISGLDEGMSGSCSPEDLETMFQLIHLYFTAPRKDSTAYLSYIERIKGSLQNRNVRPESAYSDTIMVTLAQYHSRRRPWSMELLKELNLNASFCIYQNRFADAGDFNFFFVGNFDLESMRPLVENYLGSLPSLDRRETWKDVGIRPPGGHIEKAVYRGEDPKSRVALYLTGDGKYTRENNYILQSMTQVLDIKLRKVIREALGGTYGVDVRSSLTQIPSEQYQVSISFGCDPERVNELVDAVYLQLDSLKNQGIDADYIEKVRETQLRQYEINLKKNAYWVNVLRQLHYHKRNMMDILTYPKLIESCLTGNEIQQCAQHVFNMDNVVQVVLYPEDYKERENE